MAGDFFSIPSRIFLDSCVVQTIGSYGAFLGDNQALDGKDRVYRVSQGYENLLALRNILRLAERGSFQFIVGTSSRKEAADRKRQSYMRWFEDVFAYSAAFKEASGGVALARYRTSLRLDQPMFGYLSAKDRVVLKDAVALGCSGFLTMEQRLPRNGPHLVRELGLQILTPTTYWEMLAPWGALFD